MNIDQELMQIFQKDVPIPAIVETKCQEAYSCLRHVHQHKPAFRQKRKSAFSRILIPLAACFLILFGVSMANPVFAEKIPFLRNIFALFHQDSSLSYKQPIQDGGQSEFAVTKNLRTENDGVYFTLKEVYCDNLSLLLTYTVDGEGIPDETTYLEYQLTVSANGTELSNSDAIMTPLEYNGDGLYAGNATYDLSAMDLPNGFPLSVQLSNLAGKNAGVFVLDEKNHLYSPKETMVMPNVWSLTSEISKQASLQKDFPVNQTINDFSFKVLTLTPALTKVDFSLLNENEPGDYNLILTDDQGHKLEPLHFGQGAYYQSALKTATSIHLQVVEVMKTGDTIAEFTVPITGGYADPAPERTYQEKEITYIPPVDTSQTNWSRLNSSNIVKPSEKVVVDDLIGQYTLEINYLGRKISKNLSDFAVDNIIPETYLALEQQNTADLHNLSYVEVTVSIKNASPNSTDVYFNGLTLYDQGDGWSYEPQSMTPSRYKFDSKSFYSMEIGSEQQKTEKLLFIVPDDRIQSSDVFLCTSMGRGSYAAAEVVYIALDAD